jgi:hypothetical protein
MKLVNEPAAVETRFKVDGTVHPRRFTWGQRWLDVSDVGRQWLDVDGRHVLVMVAERRTFELLLEQASLAWRVVRAPDDAMAA